MAKLLYIEASPESRRAPAAALARDFLTAYQKKHPRDEIDTLNVWEEKLPELEDTLAHGKHGPGQPDLLRKSPVWTEVKATIKRFVNADKLLLSVPIWDFSIPYPLRHYIDVITQPGYTYTFSEEEGYSGLVCGRPVILIYSSPEGENTLADGSDDFDLQSRYLEQCLRFIGLTDIRCIVAKTPVAKGMASSDQAMFKQQTENLVNTLLKAA